MGLESIITHFGMLVTHSNEIGKKKRLCKLQKRFGADGGTWTHTELPTTDFESASSAIPTHRLTTFIV